MQDYYQILDVDFDASQEEIKKAYHRLAHKYHPDVNKTENSEKKFKEINEAYNTLEDRSKRSDYDLKLNKDDFLENNTNRTASGYSKSEQEKINRLQLKSAYGRIGSYIVVGILIMLTVEWLIWWLAFSEIRHFSIIASLPGIVSGALLGFFWGVDANFKVETFLGQGTLERIYTFLRTTLMALAAGYIFGLIGTTIDHFSRGTISWATLITTLIGIIIGGTLGSDGDTVEKIRTREGRFNLFYIALRGIEVGLIIALIGALITLILVKFGLSSSFIIWGIFLSFILGDIAGSIKPPNLAAYASYVSAYIRNILVISLILIALMIGFIIGTNFGQKLLSVIF